MSTQRNWTIEFANLDEDIWSEHNAVDYLASMSSEFANLPFGKVVERHGVGGTLFKFRRVPIDPLIKEMYVSQNGNAC